MTSSIKVMLLLIFKILVLSLEYPDKYFVMDKYTMLKKWTIALTVNCRLLPLVFVTTRDLRKGHVIFLI